MRKAGFLVNIFLAISFINFCISQVIASDVLKISRLSVSLNLESPEYSSSFDEQNKVKYIGAVLEYEPYDKWTEDGKGYDVTRKNAETIVEFAKKAKSYNTDIFIAPEYGLQSTNMFKNNSENFVTFTQYIPDPSLRMVLCNLEEEPNKKYEAIKILSCGALTNSIYMVVDLAEFVPCSDETIEQSLPWTYEIQESCPEDGYFIYNTQVVFDRKGTVIARYRKQNLYLENLFTPGPKNDIESIFVTDFDVAFSLQICFDILFDHPGYANSKQYGIRDIAMSTAWQDLLPFYMANGIQNGFSRGLGVNLLISGYHNPEGYHLGSGIYKGYSTDELPLYTYDKNSGNVLLVSAVETIAASSLNLPVGYGESEDNVRNFTAQPLDINAKVSLKESYNLNTDRIHNFHYEDLSVYSKVLVNSSNSQEISENTVCSQNDFCCTFRYKYSGDQTYYLLAFSGNITMGRGTYTFVTQTCAIIWCQNNDYETCGHVEEDSQVSDSFLYLEISSNSFSVDAIYPTENHRNGSLIGNDILDFKVQDKYSSIESVKPVNDLFTIALLGKSFY